LTLPNNLQEVNNENNSNLDKLLEQANAQFKIIGRKNSQQNEKNLNVGNAIVENYSKIYTIEDENITIPKFDKLDVIEVDNIEWDEYIENILTYAKQYNVNLEKDPFSELLTESDKQIIANRLNNDYKMKKANCDKYDYMIASFCGVVSGLIDVFFVGMPGDSKLSKWSDNMVDSFVTKVAKGLGYKPRDGKGTVANAIAFLEKRYPVNYDQATGKAAGDVFGMSPSNHHIKSLGHAPDLIGLIFSILDQFTGNSHFLDNGRLISYKADLGILVGNNFFAKLYCGFCNWLGHLISDIAGSSDTRRKGPNNRGSGIPMPLFELFQLIGTGSFKVYENNDVSKNYERVSFADLSVKVFEEGYDARFAMAQAIPVIFNEISIRLLWAVKAKFYHNKSFKESIPFGNKPELRRMLLTGHGVLCIIDGVDAVAKSGGQMLLFVMRLNFTAWKRLAFSGLMEVRALYKENAIDIDALEKDLEKEWYKLYQ